MSAELEARFEALARAWEAHLEETRELSNPYARLRHEAFDGLVALGDEAVPLIVARYREGSLFWGAVLARLTGVTEHGDGVQGDLKETRRRWLAWAEQRTPGSGPADG